MTAKELARQLGLSAAAVSLALNNRKGVSEATRLKVKEAAQAAGMRIERTSRKGNGTIYVIHYLKSGLEPGDIFQETVHGIETQSAARGHKVATISVYDHETLGFRLQELSGVGAAGIIFFAYQMDEEDFAALSFCTLPLVLLDKHFRSSRFTTIQMNNFDAAFEATNYLIHKRHQQPGYLRSSFRSYDFDQREQGFHDALTHNMLTKSRSIVHEVTPTIEGAEQDMLQIIDQKDPLAGCYVAENDNMAIGAIRAFKKRGIRVPEDISIIGFDDISLCNYVEPPLTTIHVPRFFIGTLAVDTLLDSIRRTPSHPLTIEVTGYLVKRGSIAQKV